MSRRRRPSTLVFIAGIGLVERDHVFLMHALLNLRIAVDGGAGWHHTPVSVQYPYPNSGDFKACHLADFGQAVLGFGIAPLHD